MKGFKDIRMKPKLVGLFLIIGLVPLIAAAWWSLSVATDALMHNSACQLEGVRSIKKGQIESYFGERKGDMGVLVETVSTLRSEAVAKLTALSSIKRIQIERFFAERVGDASVLAESPHVHKAMADMIMSFEEGGTFTGLTNGRYEAPGSYRIVHDRYYDYFKHYMEQYGYYDLFLMDPHNGDVVFSVTKESDFGQRTSEVDSSLRDVWEIAVAEGRVALSDMKPYAPSAGAPAQFLAAPVRDGNKVVGVVALQISNDAINAIMTERTGMGETGETYLVGQDYLMRSDSYLSPETHTVTASFADPAKGSAETEAVRKALSGESATSVIMDYNGNPVLSSYAPVTVGNATWAILAEVDVAEAFCPKDENGKYFFNKYQEMYGYYDVFLMDADGFCFYTAAREADYRTNFVNGKYADSNLGKLVRTVLSSKSFGFADFAPYAPSNGEPASFIAQPLVVDGRTELIVALQLSLDAVNSIMQQRDGMGETGETYLVGSDKLMRSDSYLDPDGHSVQASFAGTVEQNGVDTRGAQEALAGTAGVEVIEDYNGNPVLSAFSPVSVFGTTWGLLAEIDEAEIMIPVNSLRMSVMILGAVLSALIVGLALLVANSIARPLLSGVAFSKTVAEGDLSSQLDVDQDDEVGDLSNAMSSMVANLTNIVREVQSASDNVSAGSQELSASAETMSQGATEQASAIEEVSASVEQMVANILQNTDNARSTEKIAAQAASEAEEGGTAITGALDSMKSIAEKISIIEEIARQTNLLALNAAIEAARAGEHGKGFAVVASEVRKLAERSGVAAAEISEISMKTMDISDQAGQMLASMVPNIRKTAELVREITAASEDQSMGADQINRAVQELDKVVQSNASASEEMASTAEELASQAEMMQQTMTFFRLDHERTMEARVIEAHDVPMVSLPAAGEGFEKF